MTVVDILFDILGSPGKIATAANNVKRKTIKILNAGLMIIPQRWEQSDF
jgi:hypothetical protein